MTKLFEKFRRFNEKYYFIFVIFLFILAIVVNYSLQANFFKASVLRGFAKSVLPVAMLAAGEAFVIIGGGIDLSNGAIVSLVNCVIVYLFGVTGNTNLSVWWVVLIGIMAGMMAGLVNGILVAYLRLQAFVATFASSFLFAGLALLILPQPQGNVPSLLNTIYRGNFLGINFPIWVLILTLVIWLLLKSSRFGKSLFATGGDAKSAFLSGVKVPRVSMMTYVIAGLFSALCAVVVTMSMGTGDPLIGDSLNMNSIVAVVLGGTLMSGGRGGIFGTILGSAIIIMIRQIISFANVPTWWQQFVYGVIVMLILAGPGISLLIQRKHYDRN
jgi:ribose transport system permease protein